MKTKKHNQKTKARLEEKLNKRQLKAIMNDYYELKDTLQVGAGSQDCSESDD